MTMDYNNVTVAYYLPTPNTTDLYGDASPTKDANVTRASPGRHLCGFDPELIVLVAYVVTSVVGIIGNSMTILAIVLSGEHKKSVATCFILNLAIADELYVLSLPLMAHYSYSKTWIYGRVMCSIIIPFYNLNMFASIYTMVLMSVDRYIAVKHPLKSLRFRTPRLAGILCALLWIACLAMVAPQSYFTTLDAHRGCHTRLPNERLWTWVELIVGLLVPFLVMAICYCHLVRHLAGAPGSQLIRNQVPDHKRKVTVMVVTVSVIFVLCWTPRHVLAFIPKRHFVKRPCVSLCVFIVSRMMEFASSCCNPFIYWISSKKFRNLFCGALGKCCPRIARRLDRSRRPSFSGAVSTRTQNTRVSSRSRYHIPIEQKRQSQLKVTFSDYCSGRRGVDLAEMKTCF